VIIAVLFAALEHQDMPPPIQQDQLQVAEEAARQLSTLIQSDSAVAQLLQHPPPAAVSEQQQDVIQLCTYAVIMVKNALSMVQLSEQANGATVRSQQVSCWEQRVMR
jgi:hypothetical protein